MTMTQTPVAKAPRDAAEILVRAKALAPLVRERAEEIERTRHLPADVVEMLRDTGVFGMCFGRDRGGPELTSMEQTEVVEALSYGDASVGWCAVIGAYTGLFSNFLDQDVAREMFSSLDTICAGLLQPSGRAERVPGGFRLSGRWSFGSGINHSDWVISGGFVYEDGTAQELRQFLVPRAQVELVDNWHTTGLAGSGSCDYTITDVFVPEERTLSFRTMRVEPSPLAQPDAFTRSMGAVPLGVARAALDHVREIARTRMDRLTDTAWSDSYRVQVILAQCEADFNATSNGVYGSMQRLWDVLAAGGTLDDLTPTERAASPLATWHAFWTARSIVNRLYDLLQTWSIYRSSPMDRWLRDTATMCQHLAAHDRILQSAGAYLVGGTPEFGICLGIVK
jgi:alkylation response protein AidB-like acyl-CoA dehydrogenase